MVAVACKGVKLRQIRGWLPFLCCLKHIHIHVRAVRLLPLPLHAAAAAGVPQSNLLQQTFNSIQFIHPSIQHIYVMLMNTCY